MCIPVNSLVGVVGPSGAGKSTLVDVILGLIMPQTGKLVVDDTVVTSENCRSWQNSIGFVAQSIFLSDTTVAENIAFGIEKNEIDFNKIREILKLAQLTEFIDSLEKGGIETPVGERGVQLSEVNVSALALPERFIMMQNSLFLMRQQVHLME